MHHAPRHSAVSFATLSAVIACLVLAPAATGARARTGAPAAAVPAAPQAAELAQPGLWHVVDVSLDPAKRPAILRGSRSLWCGSYDPCWSVPVGYPNFANEILYVDTGTHIANYTLNVTMIASAELLYDHLYLIGGGDGATDPIGADFARIADIINSVPSGNARLLVDWTGTVQASTPGASSIDTTPGPVTITGGNGGQPDSLTASILISSGHRALYFVFQSDCLFSSQDGAWPFGNGALLDDLVTTDHGAIYTDAAATGGTDAYGGSVIAGTPGAPIISSRGLPRMNQSPSVTAPANQTRTEGETILLSATATDPDAGDMIQMTAFGYPSGLTFTSSGGNPASAALSGTLQCAAAGSPYTIGWCATSVFHDVVATTVLTVVADPHAPVVTAPASVTRAVGSIVTFQVFASDPDGDPISSLTADLTGLPVGNNAAFAVGPTTQTGTFTWTPASGNQGDYTVRFTASNALHGCAPTRIHVAVGGVTGVAEGDQVPQVVSLDQNRPNPFNPETSIPFTLSREARAVLDVYDVQGRRVIRLLDRILPAGPSRASWDGRDGEGRRVPTGIYLYRLEAAGIALDRRMVLLR